VARTPPERTLHLVLGVIGGTTHAVLRIPTPPEINVSMT
jgi:hypothetical protein